MTENAPEWNPAFVPGDPLFEDLRALFPALPPRWPEVRALSRLLPTGLSSASGAALAFCPQTEPLAALDYERSILERGRIPTRARCWHDLFNALMWAAFGSSKARLNAIQVAEGAAATPNARSPRRDLSTLIDECGVLLAATSARFEEYHRARRWKRMFVDFRSSWGREIRAFIFGHGLYEQCLRPYVGLTGKAVHVTVQRKFFSLDLAQQYRRLDRILARRLADAVTLGSARDLLPLPILGVPGWHRANEEPRFYRHRGFFRPRSIDPAD